MRTIDEIADRAAELDDGNRWQIIIDHTMQKGDAMASPFGRKIFMAPEYLDDTKAYPEALDAALLHEMGHHYDWHLSGWFACVLLLVACIFLISPIFAVPAIAVALFRLFREDYFENRADRWAQARFPHEDYFRHKNAV